MRRIAVVTALILSQASPALASGPGRDTAVADRGGAWLTDAERRHYVVGTPDGLSVEARVADRARFGRLVTCRRARPGSVSRELNAVYRAYLRAGAGRPGRAAAAPVFVALHDACKPPADRR